MSQRIFMRWEDIRDMEDCVRSTAIEHLNNYKKAYKKSLKNALTMLEYAALKNIEPEEIYIALKIDYRQFDMEAKRACVERLKQKLANIYDEQVLQPKQKTKSGENPKYRPLGFKMKKVNS
jgi:hypothetical protein